MAIALSALLHAAMFLTASVVLRPPALEIAFELPMDVELGTSESIEAAPATPAAPTAPAPAAGAAGDGLLDAGAAAAVDAGAEPDASHEEAVDAARPPARERDAGMGTPVAALDAGAAESRMPPGAQIAVRVDMARIRESPIADDVRNLVATIPDWRALLGGSGIDPVAQLDRLLIATPNLQRDKIVLAGRYLGGERVVVEAVARLAAAKGVTAAFRSERGVRIAAWESPDPTPRVIALIGPRHFVIARAADLPRILAIAAARAQRRAGGARPKGAEHPADALLAMEPDEGLSVEVEGAGRFVRGGNQPVPDRLRLSAVARPGDRIGLRSVFSYETPASAAEAARFAERLKERYGRNALVMLLGLADAVADAQVAQEARDVHVDLTLTATQARLILGYVRELFGPPPRTP